MKFSQGHPLRKVSQLAEQIYEKADVQSAYDAHGHLKFLVARIPRADFFRLYGQGSFATLFHRGYWIQYSRHGRSIGISERTSGMKFNLELRTNGFGWAQLLLLKKTRVLWKQTLMPEELEHFEFTHDLLQSVARVCMRHFGDRSLYSDDGRFDADVPSIHILPEIEEQEEFSSLNVELQ